MSEYAPCDLGDVGTGSLVAAPKGSNLVSQTLGERPGNHMRIVDIPKPKSVSRTHSASPEPFVPGVAVVVCSS